MNVSSFSLKFYFSWELLATQIFIFWEFYGPILFITLVLRYLLNSAQEFCYICFKSNTISKHQSLNIQVSGLINQQ